MIADPVILHFRNAFRLKTVREEKGNVRELKRNSRAREDANIKTKNHNSFVLGGKLLLFSVFIFPEVTLQGSKRLGYSEPRSIESVFTKDV